MLTSLFLSLSCAPIAEPLPAPVTSPVVAMRASTSADDPELTKRKKEAGKDPVALWKVYEWCKEQKKEKEGKAILKDILKIDPNHKEANIALGNLYYDGKWFENQKKIDEYKKQKEDEAKLAQGLVQYKGEWVPKEDVPYLEKGLVKDSVGEWVTPDVAKKVDEGWVKQDLEWVPPAEKENIAKNLWKCGDQWLAIADANKYHSDHTQPWKIPFGHYVVWTTCDRDVVTTKMKPQLDSACEDLEKIYDNKTHAPVKLFVLRNKDEYGAFAAGDREDGSDTNDSSGMSSAYYAYLADAYFDDDGSENMGVTFWDDSTKDDAQWGVQHVRNALGLSFAETLDPSPVAVAALQKTGRMEKSYTKKFEEEKRLPAWYRYGAAAYVERWYSDTTVAAGGNMKWAKEWSLKMLLKAGGLRPLKQVLACNLHPKDPDDTAKMINETGLVMAFVVDGNCAPVIEKHKAFRAAFQAGKTGKELNETITALNAEIIKNEADLRKFAGL
jgi:hypothetical protein